MTNPRSIVIQSITISLFKCEKENQPLDGTGEDDAGTRWHKRAKIHRRGPSSGPSRWGGSLHVPNGSHEIRRGARRNEYLVVQQAIHLSRIIEPGAFMYRLVLTSVLSLAALHAQEFTRGVGVYPGDPKQNWSPTLQAASDAYRNLALHRPAYHSSSYDFNLTAQLITDGVTETVVPRHIAVTTSQPGLLKKNEREGARTVTGRPASTSVARACGSRWRSPGAPMRRPSTACCWTVRCERWS